MAKKAAEQRVAKPKRKQRGPGRPFSKGVSGNPKGRAPIGKSLAEAVRRVGEETVVRGKYKGLTRLDALVRSLYEQGNRGNARAAAVLMDRGWGKPLQPVAGDDDGGPIRILVVRE